MPAPTISVINSNLTPLFVGNEEIVNTYTANTQIFPTVATLSDGSYVVVWQSAGQDGSGYGIYAQIFDSSGTKIGNEFQVNTVTNSNQFFASVAASSSGGFTVTWNSAGNGIFAREYSNSGTPSSPELLVSSATSNPFDSEITALDNGGYSVTWEGYNASGNYTIFNQIISASGNLVNGPTEVASTLATRRSEFDTTYLENGKTLVVWQFFDYAGPYNNVYGKIIDASGNVIGNQIQFGPSNTDGISWPEVTTFEDGSFIVSWTSLDTTTGKSSVFAQLYGKNGSEINNAFQVTKDSEYSHSRSSVTELSDGTFLIVWQSNGKDGSSSGVFGQRFDGEGQKIGLEFQVNSHVSGSQSDPVITALTNGDFVVSWTSSGNDGSQVGVASQHFSTSELVAGATELQSDEDAPLDLVLEIEPSTTDGSETITDITISGLPSGFSLTYGTQNPDGSWTLTTAQLAGLQIIPRLDYTGTFDLSISATSTNNNTGDTETAISNVGIIFGDGNGQTFLGTSGDDVFTGGGFDDTLEGKEGDDTLKGGEGDDFISGGVGADELRGEAGFDTLDYSGSSAGVTVNLGTNQTSGGDAEGDTISGFEAVVGSVHDDTIFGYSNDETLSGGAGNDYLRGGDGNDTLNGDDGNDLLHGGTGTDTMNGGDGDDEFYSYDDGDIIDGGAGIDWVNFDQKTSGVNVDLSAANPANRMGGGGSIQNVENIFGTAFDDIMVGDAVRNMFRGGAGNDHMSAGDGDDCIHAGEGDDFLSGGDGVDLLKGGAGIDQINGDGGDDFIYSHNDGDIIDGGTGIDKVTFEQANAGVTVNLGAATAADRVLGATSMSNVENIKGTAFADTITGDAGVNHLFGSGGNDTLNGAVGDDHLYGGDGDDIINGGDDNDLLHGGVGADQLNGDAGDDVIYSSADGDIIDGGSGIDRVLFEQATSGVTINFGAANLADTMQGTGSIQNVENVYGSAFNDDFTGDANANKLFGLNGDDILNGEGANDQLYGGSGNDTASGGSGNDYIEGGSGNDILSGGSGNDTVHGGSGNDTFVFKTGFDRTTVQDFTQGDDKLQFDLGLFQDFQAVMASAVQTGSNVTISWDNGASTAVLQGIDINNLTSDDFTFV